MVSKNPYMDLAFALVKRDEIYSAIVEPKPEHVFFVFQGEMYKGSIHRVLKERPEISMISKSTQPYKEKLVETIKSIDTENERPFVDIPDDTPFANGINAVLYIEDKDARLPTPDEMKYFLSKINKIGFLEISLDGI